MKDHPFLKMALIFFFILYLISFQCACMIKVFSTFYITRNVFQVSNMAHWPLLSLFFLFCFALLSFIIKNFKGDVFCMFYCNIFSYFVAIFSEDKEIKRLVKDVEDTLETIPQLKSTFSLQAEIDLAIQPLRSENAQLRRFVQEIIVLIKCCKRIFLWCEQ